MTTINTSGRPGYMYDEATTTWYAISGRVSTSANYVWTGAQQFDNNSVFGGAITAKLKFNSFLNPAARTTAIPSPGIGLLTFVQQDGSGNTINRFEFWDGSAWVAYADPATTVTLTGTQTLTNKTLTSPMLNSSTFVSPKEKWNITGSSVPSSNTVDYLTSQNWYFNSASTAGAITTNIRGNSGTTLSSLLSVGDSATFTMAVTTGASTPAYLNSVQIDGTTTGVTTRWQYGSAPTTGTVSGVDLYSLSVLKTAATPTYTVFASVCKW